MFEKKNHKYEKGYVIAVPIRNYGWVSSEIKDYRRMHWMNVLYVTITREELPEYARCKEQYKDHWKYIAVRITDKQLDKAFHMWLDDSHMTYFYGNITARN